MPGWRQGVEQLDNRTTSVYLRALVLTGARREELAGLTWANVDFQWRMLTVADKVGQARTNPLTPYLEQIEAHILERASIVFDAAMEPGKLHMVAGKIKFSATEKYKTLYTFAMKTVEFRGASLDDLRSFPQTAMRDAGYQLDKVQNGLAPDDAKPMPTIGAGVTELRVWGEAGTFRVVYVAKFETTVYVLHCFQKKTGQTAKRDIELARKRFKELVKELSK